MRTTIKVDSATPQEVYNLTLAFQRTRGIPLPTQITTEPTVTVGGSAMGWVSPALDPVQAIALLDEFERLEAGKFDHSDCARSTAPCFRCAARRQEV